MGKITDTYLRSLKGEEKMREILVDRCLYLRVTLRKDGRTMNYAGPDGKKSISKKPNG